MDTTNRRANKAPLTWLVAILALMLVAASCSDDSVDEAENAGDLGEGPSAPTAAGPTGTVTIGDRSWEFESSQCGVFAEDTVSISGGATTDDAVEIVFDLWAVDGYELRVDADGASWTANADSISATVDGPNVTGSGTAVYGAESAEVTFEFHCA